MSTTTTVSIPAQTMETASPISSTILETTKEKLGFIPNMYAGMANNDALLASYTTAYANFRQHSGFTPPEQEVVFLSIAFENNCDYCVAAHSFVGDKMTNVPTEVTDAIRNNTEVPDVKLSALSKFSKVMTVKRGNPSPEEIQDFLAAGYTPKHILGVIAALGAKTMSNYFNHIFHPALDDAFASRVWSKKS